MKYYKIAAAVLVFSLMTGCGKTVKTEKQTTAVETTEEQTSTAAPETTETETTEAPAQPESTVMETEEISTELEVHTSSSHLKTDYPADGYETPSDDEVNTYIDWTGFLLGEDAPHTMAEARRFRKPKSVFTRVEKDEYGQCAVEEFSYAMEDEEDPEHYYTPYFLDMESEVAVYCHSVGNLGTDQEEVVFAQEESLVIDSVDVYIPFFTMVPLTDCRDVMDNRLEGTYIEENGGYTWQYDDCMIHLEDAGNDTLKITIEYY